MIDNYQSPPPFCQTDYFVAKTITNYVLLFFCFFRLICYNTAMKIFVINPGSTSTKIALFEELELLFEQEVQHKADELKDFNHVYDQQQYRKGILLNFLKKNRVDIEDIDCFVGRGGLVRPCPSGTYEVCPEMLDDLRDLTIWGREHASNLGALLADALAREHGKKAYIVDPIVVDELCEYAKISGFKPVASKAIFHALNLRARSKHYAVEQGKNIEELILIGIHMGGGITCALIKHGKFSDLTPALLGNGPFTPQRCGAMQMGDLIDLCYSGDYTRSELKKMLTKTGGLISYLGTDNILEIKERIKNGDDYAKLIIEAMVYHICKYVGGLAAAVQGQVDAIFLTGGMARESEIIVPLMQEKMEWIAPVVVYPGAEEELALAGGVYRVAKGEETVRDYCQYR